MNKKIEKIKFIIFMMLLIFLYQILCISEEYLIYAYMILTVGVWILGTREITQNSTFRKIFVYGLAILWCVIYVVLIAMGIEWLFDDFWIYSPGLIFLVSKILRVAVKKEKIQESDERFTIVSMIILIIGIILSYLIYCFLEYGFILKMVSLEYELLGDNYLCYYEDTYIRNHKYQYFCYTTI